MMEPLSRLATSLGASTPAVLMVGVPVTALFRFFANRLSGKNVVRIRKNKEVNMNGTNKSEIQTGSSKDRKSLRMTVGTVCGVFSDLTIGIAASAATTAF